MPAKMDPIKKIKHNWDTSKYSKQQLAEAKERTKQYFIEQEGLVSIKVLSRVGKVQQEVIRGWMEEDGGWTKLVTGHNDDTIRLTSKAEQSLEEEYEHFGLTAQEALFCMHYLKSYNITSSATRAGYPPNTSHLLNKLLRDERIKKFLHYIRSNMHNELYLEALDIIKQYQKIAFADITDYVTFGPNGVVLKNSKNVDGQVIVEVTEGRNGVSIKMADKMKALEKLERYLNVMPEDIKTEIERKRLELIEKKLELEKERLENPDYEDSEIVVNIVRKGQRQEDEV